jgi:hypothetical protein
MGDEVKPRIYAVSFEKLLISRIAHQEALTRLLVKKGVFTKEEFLEKVRAVDQGMKKENGRWAKTLDRQRTALLGRLNGCYLCGVFLNPQTYGLMIK